MLHADAAGKARTVEVAGRLGRGRDGAQDARLRAELEVAHVGKQAGRLAARAPHNPVSLKRLPVLKLDGPTPGAAGNRAYARLDPQAHAQLVDTIEQHVEHRGGAARAGEVTPLLVAGMPQAQALEEAENLGHGAVRARLEGALDKCRVVVAAASKVGVAEVAAPVA